MAQVNASPGEFDDTTNCPVCYELFDTKDHLPRLLPCTHTTCGECMKELLREDGLICPQCRKKHKTESGINLFPQNKYVMKILQIRRASFSSRPVLFEMCSVHEKELSIYCKEEGCEKDICQVCHIKEHLGHEVYDYVQEQKKEDNLPQMFTHCKFSLKAVESEVNKRCIETVSVLKKLKTECTRSFNSMIRTVESSSSNTKKHIKEKMETVEKNLQEYGAIDHLDFRNRVRTRIRMGQTLHQIFSDKSSLQYYGDITFGSTELKNLFKLPIPKGVSYSLPWKPLATEFVLSSAGNVNDIIVLSDGGILVRGHKKDIYYIGKYNIYGRELCRFECSDTPFGTAEIRLAGNACLAVTYYKKETINFHDIHNFEKIVLSYSTAPHAPSRMCASSDSELRYVYSNNSGREVYSLDCSASPPKLGTDVIHPEKNAKEDCYQIAQMCCVQNAGKQLLVTVTKSRKLQAFDVMADKLEWTTSSSIPTMDKDFLARGLATDGCGHLFVCDTNNKCVHMFSAEGKFLRTVLREGEHEVGKLWRVQWFPKTSSLVVNSTRQGKVVTSVVPLDI